MVAMAFLFTTISAPFVEAGFWEERRRSVQQRAKSKGQRVKTSDLELASASHFGLGASDLNSILPTQTSPLSHINTLPEQITNISESSPMRKDLERLPKWLTSLPTKYGEIREVHIAKGKEQRAKGNKNPLIIHIQDVHGYADAQMNISKIIQTFGQSAKGKAQRGVNYGLPMTNNPLSLLIGVEGAAGAFDLARFQNFPDRKIMKNVADFMLQQHLIPGTEHAAWTTEARETGRQGEGERGRRGDIELWGIEDRDLYLNNVKAYEDSRPLKKEISTQIEQWQLTLSQLKKQIYSPELQKFDQIQTDYQQGKIGLGLYLKSMAHASKGSRGTTPPLSPPLSLDKVPVSGKGYVTPHHPLSPFPNLNLFLEAVDIEQSLNFKQVEQERNQVVRQLASSLSKPELNALVEKSMLYRMGKMSYGRYYNELIQVCKKAGINLDNGKGQRAKSKGEKIKTYKAPTKNFSELSKYIAYILKSEKIQKEKIFTELKEFEETVVDQLIEGTAPDKSGNYKTNAPDKSDNYKTNAPDESGKYEINAPDKSGNYKTNVRDESGKYEINVPDPKGREGFASSKSGSYRMRELYTLAQDHLLIQKLTNFVMTPEDWETYQKHMEQIHAFPERLLLLTGSQGILPLKKGRGRKHPAREWDGGRGIFKQKAYSEIPLNPPFSKGDKTLPQILKPAEDFCRLAMQRNESLLGNLLEKSVGADPRVRPLVGMDNDQLPSISVLVAGGFHTDGLTRLMRERNVSYVVITPKIKKINKESHSLDFLLDKTPLEKLFTTEKITLARSMDTTAVHPFDPERQNRSLSIAEFTAFVQLATEFEGKGEAKQEILKAAQIIYPSAETSIKVIEHNRDTYQLELRIIHPETGEELFYVKSEPVKKGDFPREELSLEDLNNKTHANLGNQTLTIQKHTPPWWHWAAISAALTVFLSEASAHPGDWAAFAQGDTKNVVLLIVTALAGVFLVYSLAHYVIAPAAAWFSLFIRKKQGKQTVLLKDFADDLMTHNETSCAFSGRTFKFKYIQGPTNSSFGVQVLSEGKEEAIIGVTINPENTTATLVAIELSEIDGRETIKIINEFPLQMSENVSLAWQKNLFLLAMFIAKKYYGMEKAEVITSESGLKTKEQKNIQEILASHPYFQLLKKLKFRLNFNAISVNEKNKELGHFFYTRTLNGIKGHDKIDVSFPTTKKFPAVLQAVLSKWFRVILSLSLAGILFFYSLDVFALPLNSSGIEEGLDVVSSIKLGIVCIVLVTGLIFFTYVFTKVLQNKKEIVHDTPNRTLGWGPDAFIFLGASFLEAANNPELPIPFSETANSRDLYLMNKFFMDDDELKSPDEIKDILIKLVIRKDYETYNPFIRPKMKAMTSEEVLEALENQSSKLIFYHSLIGGILGLGLLGGLLNSGIGAIKELSQLSPAVFPDISFTNILLDLGSYSPLILNVSALLLLMLAARAVLPRLFSRKWIPRMGFGKKALLGFSAFAVVTLITLVADASPLEIRDIELVLSSFSARLVWLIILIGAIFYVAGALYNYYKRPKVFEVNEKRWGLKLFRTMYLFSFIEDYLRKAESSSAESIRLIRDPQVFIHFLKKHGTLYLFDDHGQGYTFKLVQAPGSIKKQQGIGLYVKHQDEEVMKIGAWLDHNEAALAPFRIEREDLDEEESIVFNLVNGPSISRINERYKGRGIEEIILTLMLLICKESHEIKTFIIEEDEISRDSHVHTLLTSGKFGFEQEGGNFKCDLTKFEPIDNLGDYLNPPFYSLMGGLMGLAVLGGGADPVLSLLTVLLLAGLAFNPKNDPWQNNKMLMVSIALVFLAAFNWIWLPVRIAAGAGLGILGVFQIIKFIQNRRVNIIKGTLSLAKGRGRKHPARGRDGERGILKQKSINPPVSPFSKGGQLKGFVDRMRGVGKAVVDRLRKMPPLYLLLIGAVVLLMPLPALGLDSSAGIITDSELWVVLAGIFGLFLLAVKWGKSKAKTFSVSDYFLQGRTLRRRQPAQAAASRFRGFLVYCYWVLAAFFAMAILYYAHGSILIMFLDAFFESGMGGIGLFLIWPALLGMVVHMKKSYGFQYYFEKVRERKDDFQLFRYVVQDVFVDEKIKVDHMDLQNRAMAAGLLIYDKIFVQEDAGSEQGSINLKHIAAMTIGAYCVIRYSDSQGFAKWLDSECKKIRAAFQLQPHTAETQILKNAFAEEKARGMITGKFFMRMCESLGVSGQDLAAGGNAFPVDQFDYFESAYLSVREWYMKMILYRGILLQVTRDFHEDKKILDKELEELFLAGQNLASYSEDEKRRIVAAMRYGAVIDTEHAPVEEYAVLAIIGRDKRLLSAGAFVLEVEEIFEAQGGMPVSGFPSKSKSPQELPQSNTYIDWIEKVTNHPKDYELEFKAVKYIFPDYTEAGVTEEQEMRAVAAGLFIHQEVFDKGDPSLEGFKAAYETVAALTMGVRMAAREDVDFISACDGMKNAIELIKNGSNRDRRFTDDMRDLFNDSPRGFVSDISRLLGLSEEEEAAGAVGFSDEMLSDFETGCQAVYKWYTHILKYRNYLVVGNISDQDNAAMHEWLSDNGIENDYTDEDKRRIALAGIFVRGFKFKADFIEGTADSATGLFRAGILYILDENNKLVSAGEFVVRLLAFEQLYFSNTQFIDAIQEQVLGEETDQNVSGFSTILENISEKADQLPQMFKSHVETKGLNPEQKNFMLAVGLFVREWLINNKDNIDQDFIDYMRNFDFVQHFCMVFGVTIAETYQRHERPAMVEHLTRSIDNAVDFGCRYVQALDLAEGDEFQAEALSMATEGYLKEKVKNAPHESNIAQWVKILVNAFRRSLPQKRDQSPRIPMKFLFLYSDLIWNVTAKTFSFGLEIEQSPKTSQSEEDQFRQTFGWIVAELPGRQKSIVMDPTGFTRRYQAALDQEPDEKKALLAATRGYIDQIVTEPSIKENASQWAETLTRFYWMTKSFDQINLKLSQSPLVGFSEFVKDVIVGIPSFYSEILEKYEQSDVEQFIYGLVQAIFKDLSEEEVSSEREAFAIADGYTAGQLAVFMARFFGYKHGEPDFSKDLRLFMIGADFSNNMTGTDKNMSSRLLNIYTRVLRFFEFHNNLQFIERILSAEQAKSIAQDAASVMGVPQVFLETARDIGQVLLIYDEGSSKGPPLAVKIVQSVFEWQKDLIGFYSNLSFKEKMNDEEYLFMSEIIKAQYPDLSPWDIRRIISAVYLFFPVDPLTTLGNTESHKDGREWEEDWEQDEWDENEMNFERLSRRETPRSSEMSPQERGITLPSIISICIRGIADSEGHILPSGSLVKRIKGNIQLLVHQQQNSGGSYLHSLLPWVLIFLGVGALSDLGTWEEIVSAVIVAGGVGLVLLQIVVNFLSAMKGKKSFLPAQLSEERRKPLLPNRALERGQKGAERLLNSLEYLGSGLAGKSVAEIKREFDPHDDHRFYSFIIGFAVLSLMGVPFGDLLGMLMLLLFIGAVIGRSRGARWAKKAKDPEEVRFRAIIKKVNLRKLAEAEKRALERMAIHDREAKRKFVATNRFVRSRFEEIRQLKKYGFDEKNPLDMLCLEVAQNIWSTSPSLAIPSIAAQAQTTIDNMVFVGAVFSARERDSIESNLMEIKGMTAAHFFNEKGRNPLVKQNPSELGRIAVDLFWRRRQTACLMDVAKIVHHLMRIQRDVDLYLDRDSDEKDPGLYAVAMLEDRLKQELPSDSILYQEFFAYGHNAFSAVDLPDGKFDRFMRIHNKVWKKYNDIKDFLMIWKHLGRRNNESERETIIKAASSYAKELVVREYEMDDGFDLVDQEYKKLVEKAGEVGKETAEKYLENKGIGGVAKVVRASIADGLGLLISSRQNGLDNASEAFLISLLPARKYLHSGLLMKMVKPYLEERKNPGRSDVTSFFEIADFLRTMKDHLFESIAREVIYDHVSEPPDENTLGEAIDMGLLALKMVDDKGEDIKDLKEYIQIFSLGIGTYFQNRKDKGTAEIANDISDHIHWYLYAENDELINKEIEPFNSSGWDVPLLAQNFALRIGMGNALHTAEQLGRDVRNNISVASDLRLVKRCTQEVLEWNELAGHYYCCLIGIMAKDKNYFYHLGAARGRAPNGIKDNPYEFMRAMAAGVLAVELYHNDPAYDKWEEEVDVIFGLGFDAAWEAVPEFLNTGALVYKITQVMDKKFLEKEEKQSSKQTGERAKDEALLLRAAQKEDLTNEDICVFAIELTEKWLGNVRLNPQSVVYKDFYMTAMEAIPRSGSALEHLNLVYREVFSQFEKMKKFFSMPYMKKWFSSDTLSEEGYDFKKEMEAIKLAAGHYAMRLVNEERERRGYLNAPRFSSQEWDKLVGKANQLGKRIAEGLLHEPEGLDEMIEAVELHVHEGLKAMDFYEAKTFSAAEELVREIRDTDDVHLLALHSLISKYIEHLNLNLSISGVFDLVDVIQQAGSDRFKDEDIFRALAYHALWDDKNSIPDDTLVDQGIVMGLLSAKGIQAPEALGIDSFETADVERFLIGARVFIYDENRPIDAVYDDIQNNISAAKNAGMAQSRWMAEFRFIWAKIVVAHQDFYTHQQAAKDYLRSIRLNPTDRQVSFAAAAGCYAVYIYEQLSGNILEKNDDLYWHYFNVGLKGIGASDKDSFLVGTVVSHVRSSVGLGPKALSAFFPWIVGLLGGASFFGRKVSVFEGWLDFTAGLNFANPWFVGMMAVLGVVLAGMAMVIVKAVKSGQDVEEGKSPYENLMPVKNLRLTEVNTEAGLRQGLANVRMTGMVFYQHFVVSWVMYGMAMMFSHLFPISERFKLWKGKLQEKWTLAQMMRVSGQEMDLKSTDLVVPDVTALLDPTAKEQEKQALLQMLIGLQNEMIQGEKLNFTFVANMSPAGEDPRVLPLKKEIMLRQMLFQQFPELNNLLLQSEFMLFEGPVPMHEVVKHAADQGKHVSSLKVLTLDERNIDKTGLDQSINCLVINVQKMLDALQKQIRTLRWALQFA